MGVRCFFLTAILVAVLGTLIGYFGIAQLADDRPPKLVTTIYWGKLLTWWYGAITKLPDGNVLINWQTLRSIRDQSKFKPSPLSPHPKTKEKTKLLLLPLRKTISRLPLP